MARVSEGRAKLPPALSVVIPTRDRVQYALGAIEQVLSFPDEDLQLVVQDNGTDDSLTRSCESFRGDSRFVYRHTPETLSFVDNFSAGVSLATGEYVCVIGDDDGITRELLRVVRWAAARGVHAVKPGLQAVYYWPGADLPGEEPGQLVVQRVKSTVRCVSVRGELSRLLHDGCQDYLQRDIVKLYHGLVRRDALEVVRDRTGSYFGGLSPDIYAAVALSLVVDDVVCVDHPLTISGICRRSGSADSATGRHTGSLSQAPHFVGHAAYEWSVEVPEFYSVATIWADSSLAALREMAANELLRAFRTEALDAYCLVHHSEYGELIREHHLARARDRGVGPRFAATTLAVEKLRLRARDLLRRLTRKITGSERVVMRTTGLRDISAASCALEEYLGERASDLLLHLDELNLRAASGAQES